MEKNGLKKNDKILIILVIVIAAAAFLFYFINGRQDAGSVTVKVDGVIQGIYDLSVNQQIEINDGSNVLKIIDGKADMIEADCPDKLCVNQKAISKNHENIICLPNKVIVEIESMENSEFDAVTN